MDSAEIITWLIIFCILFVVCLFFHKTLFRLLKFLLKSAAGALGFMICNSVLAGLGLAATVGLNAATIIFAALLGIPGFVALYAVQFVIK